jgi:hypothetical protein
MTQDMPLDEGEPDAFCPLTKDRCRKDCVFYRSPANMSYDLNMETLDEVTRECLLSEGIVHIVAFAHEIDHTVLIKSLVGDGIAVIPTATVEEAHDIHRDNAATRRAWAEAGKARRSEKDKP